MLSRLEKRLRQAELQCKQLDIKFTPIRKSLLSIIYEHNHPITAYELLNLFRKTHLKAQSMTVYRTLEFLEVNHFIHRLESKNSYKACETPHEKHNAYFLICERCMNTQEIQSPTFTRAVKKLENENQFLLSKRQVELIGICAGCK
jgi:Fur family zinc uptake transcriptional regulator